MYTIATIRLSDGLLNGSPPQQARDSNADQQTGGST